MDTSFNTRFSAEFTDGRDDSRREEQRSGELPLRSEAVRHELDDVSGDELVLGLVDVVAASQAHHLGAESSTDGHLVVGFERVEHGRADQQVRDRARDQRQSPHVLPLHRNPAHDHGPHDVGPRCDLCQYYY